MSNAIGTSNPCPDSEQGNSSKQHPSAQPAVAAQRHGGVPDSAGGAPYSPRPVTRGESTPSGDTRNVSQPIDGERENRHGRFLDPQGRDTDLLQVGIRLNGSVRVNLSLPAEVHDVIAGLAAKSGASKASLVMHALHLYMPEFHRRLAEYDEIQEFIRRKQRAIAKGNPPDGSYEHNLPRAERRRLERERRKAVSRGGDSE